MCLLNNMQLALQQATSGCALSLFQFQLAAAPATLNTMR